MSKKTFFKRMSLGVIAALGFGLMSTPTAQAVRITNSLTLSSATATATVFDSATVTVTLRQTSTQDGIDSMTVRVSCDGPAGATCPTLKGYQDATADTSNVNVGGTRGIGVWTTLNGWTDSQVAASTSMRSVISAKAESFPVAGTYTYTIYATGNLGASDPITGTSTTWTVTATAPSTNATGGSAQVFISTDAVTASQNRFNFLQYATGTDSAIVASKGTAASPTVVGYALLTLKNAAGDTRVAVGSGFLAVQDSVTVTVNGPGLVYSTGSTGAKSATMSSTNARTGNYSYATETLTILSDGTAGTMTLTFSKGSTTLATKTVTFYGDPGSAVGVSLSDTYTSLAGTATLTARVFDGASGAGNALAAGTLYVFSSDTKIAGSVPTTAVFGQTGHRCTTFTGTTSATYRLSCGITLTDTGVVTLTVGDSWTVAASTFTSTAVELTVTGNTIASATVSFDKATYAPGERGVITITTKDVAGRLSASGATGTLAGAYSNYTLTGSTTLPYRGTSTSDNTYGTTMSRYMDTGVETRVVTMPSIGADLTYTIEVPGFGTGVAKTLVTATAKVVDPNATAIAASQAAADAATDAAAEAIDAANAATDAANLAAEAADAATVAAEEARDAADAATAAVEELATQVATLMAALKAQITTLANTVAKIAKKLRLYAFTFLAILATVLARVLTCAESAAMRVATCVASSSTAAVAASAASRASSAATVAASAASAAMFAASVAALAASIASLAASVAASAAACEAAMRAAFGSTTLTFTFTAVAVSLVPSVVKPVKVRSPETVGMKTT